ncbi:uncharacterized protein A4U43_C04F31120 [Asparagus officinalis]|uniref:NPH3 domain-containing protein n=1 Tax=Asparagus officinalis TaxID=4686 RepID=A0A5P1F6N1_ASPOF|nr:uncharacterized protein A4U43_C04F31120 [Asparagus officinalis]
MKLEDMIGERLDEATLDDILILGHDNEVYDVNLVIRLVKIFVRSKEIEASLRMKKVGVLMDKYLKEISADKRLNVSKFVEVVESLPNASRECFDAVYRALDIYMEAHPMLSFDERNVLCRTMNCEKLTAEVSKDIARNPKIPPEVSMKALASQLSKLKKGEDMNGVFDQNAGSSLVESANEEKKELMLNFKMTPWRLCRDVRCNMSKKIVNRSKMISYNAGELTNDG